MSESESPKKAGRKPKYDYKSDEFLKSVEKYAKKGFTDKEIAYSLGMNPAYFCEIKSKYPELTEVLARGRATITATVRAKFVAMALGGIKVKSETRRFVQERCSCLGENEKCPDCGGTGWVSLTDKSVVQETINELAPNLQAQSVILYHYDPEWNKTERKQEDTTHSEAPRILTKEEAKELWNKLDHEY